MGLSQRYAEINNSEDEAINEEQHYAENKTNDVELVNFNAQSKLISASSAHMKSSNTGAYFNLVNSVVGAGIVGLPYALKTCGFYFGIFLFFVVGYLSYLGFVTLVICGKQVNVGTYADLSRYVFGKWGFHMVSFFMIASGFGAMCAYFIVIGDTFPHVIAQLFGITVSRKESIALLGIFAILPLCLLKDLTRLERTSSISVLAACFIVIIVAVRGPMIRFQDEEMFPSQGEFTVIQPTFPAGLGTISFAFISHQSTFIVYNSMMTKKASDWRKVVMSTIITALVLSLVISIAGFSLFFEETDDDILTNLSPGDYWVNFARLLLSLTMVFTIPMEQFVARRGILSLVYGQEKITSTRHYVASILLWGLAFIIGLTVDNLGVVFALIGAFSSSALGYIIPAICYLRINATQRIAAIGAWKKNHTDYIRSPIKRITNGWHIYEQLFMLMFGLLAMVTGIGKIIVDAMLE